MDEALPLSEQVRAALNAAGELGVSRYRVAKIVGLTQSAMTRFANGGGGVELETLDRIGTLLGLRVTMNRSVVRRLASDAPGRGRPRQRK
jgi:predicted transcriptional regulator